MIGRLATFIASFTLAVVILVVSVFRTSSIKYVFSQSPSPTPALIGPGKSLVDYPLPEVEEKSKPAWMAEVAREKISAAISNNPLEKSSELLSMADKRLSMAENTIKQGNWNQAVVIFEKSEQYLSAAHEVTLQASRKDLISKDFLKVLAQASLKHREILEKALVSAPDDAKPLIIKILNVSKTVFEEQKVEILRRGEEAPVNPF